MKTDAPAWMLCEDIMTRLKDELVLEAVDMLHDEMKAGRMDMKGYVSLLPDKSNELQRDMYMINELIRREPEIIEHYRPLLDGIDEEKDPKKVAMAEGLMKFMLSVKAISTLMRLSSIAGMWAEDTGRYSNSDQLEEIMVKTARMDEERMEVLDFVLSRKKFLDSEALTPHEIGILKKVRKAIPR